MKRYKILGKLWRFMYCKLQDYGDCADPESPAKERIIRIRENLKPKTELSVLIHEVLHASDWWKDEKWIDHVSKDLGHILWEEGWRKTD